MPSEKKQRPAKTKRDVAQAPDYPAPEARIGERIREKRTELGLNVEELARLTKEYDYTSEKRGITASTLRRYEYETGGFKPGAREICLLCDSLDVSADWLVRGIEPDANEESERAFMKALRDLMRDRENPLSGMSHHWKDAERPEKLRRAKLPDK